MQGRTPPLYRRGKYWVDKLRRADGSERSSSWYIFWYDIEARREASASTGEIDEHQAILACDRRYLADRGEAPAFCYACGQPMASAAAYLLSDAITDYRIEWGDLQTSADSIAARLKHVLDFLDVEESRGGMFGYSVSSAVACGTPFIAAFRSWSKAHPVTWTNAAGAVTGSRPRSAATTEESVLQLAAALNHAADADPPRIDRRPVYRPLPRRQVSRPRRHRVDVPVLADMLAYAATPGEKRMSLHSFLVAAICTAARPDSVFDISVAPDRCQWEPGMAILDLNPFGRAQTKKYRPIIPTVPVLTEWLMAEHLAYKRLPVDERAGAGFLVNYFGRPISSVRRAWAGMLDELGLPSGREWQPYVLRHSLATILRAKRADEWELKNFLGHARSTTDIYAVSMYPTVTAALGEILGEIDARSPGALRRNRAEVELSGHSSGVLKMTG